MCSVLRRFVIAVLLAGIAVSAGCDRGSKAGDKAAKTTAAPSEKPLRPPGRMRLAERVRERMAAARPEYSIKVRPDGHLDVKRPGEPGERMLALDNLEKMCAPLSEAECWAMIDRGLPTMIAAVEPEPAGALKKENIRALLKDRGYFDQVRRQFGAKAAQSMPLHRPFVGDLYELYVLDMPEGMRGINRSDIEKLGIQESQLHDIALANMRRDFPAAMPYERIAPGAAIWAIETNDDYEASRIFLHERWKPLADMAGRPPLLVVAAARSVVLFTGSGDPVTVDIMMKAARRMSADMHHPISPTLLAWRPGGWEPGDPSSLPAK